MTKNQDLTDGPPLHKAKFQLVLAEADDPLFEAWTDGSRWNGFGCPLFERYEADRFLAYFNLVGRAWRSIGIFRGDYSVSKDTFCFLQDGQDKDIGDPDSWDCFAGFRREGKHLYAIGAWCWAWIQIEGEIR